MHNILLTNTYLNTINKNIQQFTVISTFNEMILEKHIYFGITLYIKNSDSRNNMLLTIKILLVKS